MYLDTKKSEFNNAIGHIARVNLTLFSALYAKDNLDAYQWIRALDSFFMELSSYMQDSEIKYFKSFSNLIMDYLENNKVQDNRIPKLLYDMLIDYELELRKVYDRADLIGKKQEGGLSIYKQ